MRPSTGLALPPVGAGDGSDTLARIMRGETLGSIRGAAPGRGLGAAVPGQVSPLGVRMADGLDIASAGLMDPWRIIRGPWCLGADAAVCRGLMELPEVQMGPFRVSGVEAAAICQGFANGLCLVVGVGVLTVLLAVGIYVLIT